MKPERRSLSAALVLAALLAPAAPAAAAPVAPASPAAELDAFVRRSLAEWEIPGAAVAVVAGDSVVFARGYGVRRLGAPEPVSERTLFYAGSITKSFTVAALATLAEEKKLRLSDPLARVLPELALADTCVARDLTVLDAVAHRTGLPRADLLLFGGFGDDELLARLGRVTPVASPRARFTYSNPMYLGLGRLIEKLDGRPWAASVTARVLEPLGLDGVRARGYGDPGAEDAAAPHARVDGAIRALEATPRAPYGAGGIHASALGLARWVRFQLGDGRLGGRRLLAAPTMREIQTPRMLMDPPRWMPTARFAAYGLGWFVHDYRGRKLVEHGGNAEGVSALAGFLPEEGIGVVVLANLHNTPWTYAVMYRALDLWLADPARDWSAEFLALARDDEARAAAAREAAAVDTTAARPVAAYAGAYEHPAYGRVSVTASGATLSIRYGPSLAATLAPAGGDRFRAAWSPASLAVLLAGVPVSFRGTPAGVEALVLELPGSPIAFARVPGGSR